MLYINGNRLKATTATNIHVKNAKRLCIQKGAIQTIFFSFFTIFLLNHSPYSILAFRHALNILFNIVYIARQWVITYNEHAFLCALLLIGNKIRDQIINLLFFQFALSDALYLGSYNGWSINNI